MSFRGTDTGAAPIRGVDFVKLADLPVSGFAKQFAGKPWPG
jgi:hypothetical protein